MKLSPVLIPVFFASAEYTAQDQLQKDPDLKRKHPINRIATYNKILNQYTVMFKGFNVNEVVNDQELLSKRGLEAALRRNNVWYNRLMNTFSRVDANGDHVDCSVFYQASRKRRSTSGGLNLMPDQDTEEEKCQMAFDEAQDAGETCEDCCATDEDGNWILNTDITANFHQRGRLVEAPKDLPKALRRVLGATKKWAMRYISECGGQANGQMADRYYNILLKRLTSGLKYEAKMPNNGDRNAVSMADQITSLRWKRVFPKGIKHDNFFDDLGVQPSE